MYFVRPTAAIEVIAISVFVLLFYRERFLAWAVTGVFWLIAFLAYSFSTFGQLVPDYYQQFPLLRARGSLTALGAILVSPSRGLLIFVPAIIMVVLLVVLHWRDLPHRRLGKLAIGVVIWEVLTVSFWPFWWGAYSFGPRLLTDTIPWFLLLAILGCAALLKYCATERDQPTRSIYKNSLAGLGLLLICVGIAINGIGAISREAYEWDIRAELRAHPERVWDWHHPQFFSTISRTDWIPHHFADLEKTDSAGASPAEK
jgi:hypothetical protein